MRVCVGVWVCGWYVKYIGEVCMEGIEHPAGNQVHSLTYSLTHSHAEKQNAQRRLVGGLFN